MSDASASPPVGVDVGGTFTDFVVLDERQGLRVHKEPTTAPQDRGVVRGLEALEVGPRAAVVHGTTAATNALLERRGARTALLATEGFADVLAIGRQNRPDLYDLAPSRPEPLVPEALRYGIPERVGADGEVLAPLDEDAVRAVADDLEARGVESVAVAYLFSYRFPEHERRTAAVLREAGFDGPITRSSALLPEHREYERTATTAVNAYVRPPIAGYLDRLGDALGDRTLRVMQSTGGVIGPATAEREAARLALSGPAGGVVGALGIARRALEAGGEEPKILTLDMGGTSTDVALCNGGVPRTTDHAVAGLPLRLPATDIHTVGAGGGSIASVDAGGSLRVGPESAGAEPGPVCYGRGGTAPTVTDANLVLGRLRADRLLGGGDALDVAPEAARRALADLGGRLDRSPEAAARGVVRIATATMERALRRVSVERGHDPADYTLVAFGGAGPLHAAGLAEALGIEAVLVPPAPGVLSALGLLLADEVFDTSRPLLERAEALADAPEPLRAAAQDAAGEVRDRLGPQAPAVEHALDLRYAGQSYELTVPLAGPDALKAAVAAFHERHRSRYGHAHPDAPVEVVALRTRGIVAADPPALPTEPATDAPLAAARLGKRPVWFGEAPVPTPAYDRSALRHGHAFEGPAVVHQYDATLVVPPGWRARVDRWQNVRLRRSA
jgi:N-methylhydantoinase A